MKVSTLCTTYNQEKYIAQCLQSLVDQVVPFDYEIIVHDDASTDSTADIVRDFASCYPGLIKPILQTENQYSQRKPTTSRAFMESKGEFIALCEGDDYWTDRDKLNKQIKALSKYPDVNLCFHDAAVYDERTGKSGPWEFFYGDKETIVENDILIGNGGFSMATNSILVRRQSFEEYMAFEKRTTAPGDYILQTLGAKNGAVYLPDCMSVYRWHAQSSWTNQRLAGGWWAKVDARIQVNNLEEDLNRYFNDRYQKVFEKNRQMRCYSLVYDCLPPRVPLCEKFKYVFRHAHCRIDKVIIEGLLLGFCPPLLRSARRRMLRAFMEGNKTKTRPTVDLDSKME